MKSSELCVQAVFFLLMLGAGDLFAGNLQEGLVGRWPLDELAGEKVKDTSGKGNNAEGTDLELTDGRGGRVMVFDGKKSELLLPDGVSDALTGDFAISVWARVEPESTENGPVFAQPGFVLSVFRRGVRVTFRNEQYGRTGYADLMGPQVADGNWHHVVFSYSGGSNEAVLFVDAVEAAVKVLPHRPAVTTPTTVGAAGRLRFEGELSDLRVYCRVLDQLDATALHEAKLKP